MAIYWDLYFFIFTAHFVLKKNVHFVLAIIIYYHSNGNINVIGN